MRLPFVYRIQQLVFDVGRQFAAMQHTLLLTI